MRFDDRLATVLAQPRADAAARAAAWRQIVDILAQAPPDAGDPLPADAYALLRTLRDEVAQPVRAQAVAALVGRRVHPAIVALIAEEKPVVAAALIGQARLADGEWLFLLPRLSITARALLRHRRDLSPAVRAGLASFGASDFALPAGEIDADAGDASAQTPTPPASAPAVAVPRIALVPSVSVETVDLTPSPASDDDAPTGLAAGDTRIADMLARIAAYRREEATGTPPAAPPIERFRFETGPDGTILWVAGAPRAALIGISIARPGESSDCGVDGQATGAFRHRAPFRDARLCIVGGSAAAGEWRIGGVPVFDPLDGRFTGYRGTARRPHPHERAGPATGGLYGTGLPTDALRQLAHELRTPINAIVGFGEMIERQVMGPAAALYRSEAHAIVEQGRRLLSAVDDLDVAARTEGRPAGASPERVGAADVLRRLEPAMRAIAAERGVTLDLTVAEGAGDLAAEPAAVERMFSRLLAATVGLGGAGETISARLSHGPAQVVLRLSRPAVLRGSAEADLLDPGFSIAGDFPEAPQLGLGFALRLVRSLAQSVEGALLVEPGHFTLRLPVAGDRAASDAAPR